MKIIAHRANINGPSIKKENLKSSIKDCLDLGFDVEIDIRSIKGKLYLGHDNPQLIITIDELRMIKNAGYTNDEINALEIFLRKFSFEI